MGRHISFPDGGEAGLLAELGVSSNAADETDILLKQVAKVEQLRVLVDYYTEQLNEELEVLLGLERSRKESRTSVKRLTGPLFDLSVNVV